MKDYLYQELTRRLPKGQALHILDHMRRLSDHSITYEEAWEDAFEMLGPLNLDLFHAFVKILAHEGIT